MEQKIKAPDLEEIKSKLTDKLRESGWYDLLKGYFAGSDFDNILRTLITEHGQGKRFAPPVKYIFNAFEQCPFDKIKVVMVSLDPYPYVDVPNGIAFDCSLNGKIQKSLQYIFKDIQKNVYNDAEYRWDPDLSRWSKQGVLLLNSALTVQIGKIGSHTELWKPFMNYALEMLARKKPDMIWVFIGRQARKYEGLVPDETSEKLMVMHPAAAAYQNLEFWDSGNMFVEINNLLKQDNLDPIVW